MSELLLMSGLSGGGDIQFSRPDFKIALQSGTGSSPQTMNLDGYIHYRNQGMRLLWNFYDTTTVVSPTHAVGEYRSTGLDFVHGNLNVGDHGWSMSQLWPYLDMVYMDLENSLFRNDAVDANDFTFTAGNGNVAGSTITVTAGSGPQIIVGTRLQGGGIPGAPDDCYISAWNSGTGVITMRQIKTFGTYPYIRGAEVPSIAVPDGSTITGKGRINDAANLTTAIRARLTAYADGSTSKLIGAYSGGPSGYGGYSSYSFWTAAGNSTKTAIAATMAANDACGQYITPSYDFCLPELYISQMEDVSANLQFWIAEKTRRGSSVPLFPLMRPTAGGSDQSYDTCMTYLEYMIHCPEIDGCAFWAVDGTHLPSAAPTWYDDGTFPWMTAIQDFITKYGLSV